MKKLSFILTIMIGLGFSSCSFYQLCETKPIGMQQNQGLVYYENADCRISYNFWSEDGVVTFSIFNKTDSIISVDLSKTFFIKNGLSNPYFQARQWSASSMLGLKTTKVQNNTFVNHYASADPIIPSYSSYTNGSSKTTASTAVATTSKSESKYEQQIVRIAPHSIYYFSEFNLRSTPFFDCDLETRPKYKKQASIRYTQETTPLQFSNYITYKVSDQVQQHIENKFYVSKVSNFRSRTLKNKVQISQCGEYIGKLRMHIFPIENTSTAFYIPYKTLFDFKGDDLLSIEIVDRRLSNEGTIQSDSSQKSVQSSSNNIANEDLLQPQQPTLEEELQAEYLALKETPNKSSGDKSLLGQYKRAELVLINLSQTEKDGWEKYRMDFMNRFNHMMNEQYHKNFTLKNHAKELTAEIVIIDRNNDLTNGFIRFKDASDSVLYSTCLMETNLASQIAYLVYAIQNEFESL